MTKSIDAPARALAQVKRCSVPRRTPKDAPGRKRECSAAREDPSGQTCNCPRNCERRALADDATGAIREGQPDALTRKSGDLPATLETDLGCEEKE